MSPATIAEKIKEKQREIERIQAEIEAIARLHIKDYHFLDHKVSTFWKCDKSPIGMCVFNKKNGLFHIDCRCRYCGDPVERK